MPWTGNDNFILLQSINSRRHWVFRLIGSNISSTEWVGIDLFKLQIPAFIMVSLFECRTSSGTCNPSLASDDGPDGFEIKAETTAETVAQLVKNKDLIPLTLYNGQLWIQPAPSVNGSSIVVEITIVEGQVVA